MAMSETVLTLDGAFFKGISPPRPMRTVNADDMPTLASKFDLLTDIVDQNRSDLPVPIREFAKTYAYQILDDQRKASFWDRVQLGWLMFRNRRAKDEVWQLYSAMTRLSDAVFSAIERNNPEYQERLAEAIESNAPDAMTAQQFRAWTKRL